MCASVLTSLTKPLTSREALPELDHGGVGNAVAARHAGELKESADPYALAMLASATMHSIAIRARAGASRNDLRKLALKAVSVVCG
jgi:hypothetical protein